MLGCPAAAPNDSGVYVTSESGQSTVNKRSRIMEFVINRRSATVSAIGSNNNKQMKQNNLVKPCTSTSAKVADGTALQCVTEINSGAKEDGV